MAEHIGTIESAGNKAAKSGRAVFYMAIIDPKWGYYLFKTEQQKIASENIGKRVKITYTESDKSRNVESIEPVQEAPPNAPSGDTMSKADWAKKDRIEQRGWIAKAIIEAFGVNAVTSYDTLAKYADFWFAWVYELKSPETRQESNPVAPGNASKSVVGKPSEGDPEKRRQTVIGAIQKLLPDAMKRQVELDSFAKSQNWTNKIAIAQDSLNALNISQLGEFYNHLKEAK